MRPTRPQGICRGIYGDFSDFDAFVVHAGQAVLGHAVTLTPLLWARRIVTDGPDFRIVGHVMAFATTLPQTNRPWRRAACASVRRRGALVLLGLVLLSASGCATSFSEWWHNGFKVGPNYQPPAAPIKADWSGAADPHLQRAPADICGWWTALNDPVLNGLILNAYQQNLDLRAAGTRVLESRAERNIAAGNLFPQSQSFSANYAHVQLPQSFPTPLPHTVNVWSTGFNASWEADFWGRYRRLIEAQDAEVAASMEDYNNALVLLLAEVATSYVELRTYEARLEFARRNAAIQSDSLDLAAARRHDGVATDLDVSQARSSLAQTLATIPPLETGRRRASNQLCVLLGMPVEDLASRFAPLPIPQPPVALAVGIPADLLRRRPDVRRAERQVAAQSARIGVAEADLYPRLSLNGFVGYAAPDLNELFSPKSVVGFAIPTLQWNVLNYGRIANNIRAQDARLDGAALNYQQAVLNADREVEDALVGFVQSQQQARLLADSVGEAQHSVDLVVTQFKGGVTDFNRVYNTEALLVGQQDLLAQTRGNIVLQLIQVYRALGGGWEYFCSGQATPAGPNGPDGIPRQPEPPSAAPNRPEQIPVPR
jgi:NodT family efflux transporter outer membrane factor (OMF) lipoprotein